METAHPASLGYARTASSNCSRCCGSISPAIDEMQSSLRPPSDATSRGDTAVGLVVAATLERGTPTYPERVLVEQAADWFEEGKLS